MLTENVGTDGKGPQSAMGSGKPLHRCYNILQMQLYLRSEMAKSSLLFSLNFLSI